MGVYKTSAWFLVVLIGLMAAVEPNQYGYAQTGRGRVLPLTGFINAHDPVMAKDKDVFYVFTTGANIPVLCSKDMVKWEFCGRVFTDKPKWINDYVTGVTDLWAPDISFFNGKWHLYYSASTFGKNRSVIGLVTNSTLNPKDPKYKWVDEGLVVESKSTDNWNAIDPNLAFDEKGEPWLAWGSFWSGIKLHKIDAQTGKFAKGSHIVSIAGRPQPPGAIEAPLIVRRGRTGKYFYLFVSFDACCQGLQSTYNLRVGRAEKITGPYVDRDGKALAAGGGTLVLQGSKRFKGPGHNDIYHDEKTDTFWLVYHAYDADLAGKPQLRIESLGWDTAGWPVAPSAAQTP